MENSCILSLVFIICITKVSSSSTTDQLSLLAFKNAIVSDPRDLLGNNWTAATSVCNWIGVTCGVKHPRVTALNISRFDLRGTITPHIGNLSFLRSLDVSFNKFAGIIPSQLSNLHHLEEFNAQDNRFEGKIPSCFQALSRLRRLNLDSNHFTGKIPPPLFNISKLQILELGRNKLIGNIPKEVGNSCLPLKIISVYDNQLSGKIPPDIWKCRELEILKLARNEFVGSIPSEIGSLRMLKMLSLEENRLKGSVPSSIFNLSTLKSLRLSMNQIEGTLPTDMGISLFNLEELHLSGNLFSGALPSSITNVSNFIDLRIDHNFFSGSMPDFGDLRLLQILRVSANNFTAAESTTQELGFLSSLTNCRYLKFLDVSENPLNGILPASIGNLSTSLQYFRASGCSINGAIPPEIGNLYNLLDIYLYKNQMTGFIPSTVGELKYLQRMSLGNNYLQGPITHHLCQMNMLGELDLSGNTFTGSIPECFGEVKSLRYIHLGHNKLSSTIPSNLWNLYDLLSLNLSSNYLMGNLSSQIGKLKAIYRMDFSINHFSGDIPSSLAGCVSLETLSLSSNMFSGSIPQSLDNVVGLISLDLSDNNLSGFIPESLKKLLFLVQFDVSYNRLVGEIPNEGAFSNFSAQSFVHNSALCGSARFQVPPCMTDHARSRPRLKDTVRVMVYILASLIAAIIWVVGVFLSITFVIMIRRQRDARLSPRLSGDHTSLGVVWRVISYRELIKATSGFSEANLLGSGGFGSVYKGRLADGLDIAVKVFNLELEGAAESFGTETDILSSIRHRNLVRMIGCCVNAEFKALVLAYMPNGSLEKWLHSETYFLDLVQRLNIAVDVALALEYLHHHHTFPVVHCDIKPSNILLDQDMTAHLADFGIAKLFDKGEDVVQTKNFATIGYLAPEYGSEGKVSTKGMYTATE